MPVRTFLALPLDEPIVRRLAEAQAALAAVAAHIRWVEPQNLHLTVKFLGDVENDRLSDVCEVAEEIASQSDPFEITVRGLVPAPPSGSMRMVWVGVEEPTARLERMQGLLEEAYAGLGFKMENRRFHPHLTLGRVKSGQNVQRLRAAVEEFARTDFGVQPVEEIVVFSSRLTPEGPIYSPLKKAELG